MSNQKVGLNYFPLDVSIEQDDKIALIQAKYGAEGFAAIIKLLAKIYADKGYYYEWNDKTSLLFAGRINIEHTKMKEIISDAVEWELFDKEKFQKYQILTSKRIQRTYIEATKRRKRVDILKPFLLLNGEDVDILNENVNIINENVDILKQSKVKESKVKESKVKESKVKESKVKESKVKYADYVFMFPDEYQKLINQYGESYAKRFIDKLNAFKGSKGKTYNSDYLAILNWVAEAVMGAEKKREAETRYQEGLEREKEWQRRKEKRNESIPEEVKKRIEKVVKVANYNPP